MINGICPKCGSHEVYRGFSTEGEGLTPGSYPLLAEIRSGSAQITLWIDTFICKGCGHVELGVANPAGLALLPQADGWERVSGEADLTPGE
jgi:hypothetical protein